MLVNVPGFGATDAAFQPEAFHRLGIGVLKPDKVLAGHDVVGAKPGAVLGFGAVAFLGFRLARFLLSLGGDYRNDRDMKVWCLLVQVKMGGDNVVLTESLFCPADTRLCPFVETPFVGKAAQRIAVGCHQHMEGEHLVLADLARQSGIVETMLYSLAQTDNSIGISDEIISVEMAQFGVGVVGLRGSLDVPGDGVAGVACLHDVEYSVTHRQAAFACGTIGVYGFPESRIGVLQGVAPLGSVGIFLAWSLTMRLDLLSKPRAMEFIPIAEAPPIKAEQKFPNELRNFRMA